VGNLNVDVSVVSVLDFATLTEQRICIIDQNRCTGAVCVYKDAVDAAGWE
jgi:hypothetical protein